MVTEQSIQKFSEQCKNIFDQIGRDVIGQKEVIEGAVIAMIAGGNVLLEGVPGVGKTRLVRSLGRVFDLPFSRIQFTPDLMPADVTGTNIIVKDENGNSSFQFQPGPIFSNIILADEINRATPKTQSALLEAMQEHTVTVMGVSRKLEEPFFVLATQNPVEQDGTYPLPEAQMDRFMFKIIVKNPSLDELMEIVNMTQKTMAEVADAACNGQDLLEMRAVANAIPVADDVMRYAMQLCSATHPDSECATETAKKYVRQRIHHRHRGLLQHRRSVLQSYSSGRCCTVPGSRQKERQEGSGQADDELWLLLRCIGCYGRRSEPADQGHQGGRGISRSLCHHRIYSLHQPRHQAGYEQRAGGDEACR